MLAMLAAQRKIEGGQDNTMHICGTFPKAKVIYRAHAGAWNTLPTSPLTSDLGPSFQARSILQQTSSLCVTEKEKKKKKEYFA
jgi:hypothetical protein